MEYLNWELSVLGRAIAYVNLSGASANIGISQPQLSRIVARIESSLGVRLLDRTAKRKSVWTPAAYTLSGLYSDTFRRFSGEVAKLSTGSIISHVRVGTLEGHSALAMRMCNRFFKLPGISVVDLFVEDLDHLEERFFKREFDLILSLREPGRKRFFFSRLLGYQRLEKTGKPGGVQVMSSFEYASSMHAGKPRAHGQILVSNSLGVRREWLASLGGNGILPSPLGRARTGKPGEIPVLLVANDDLPRHVWDEASAVSKH